VTQFLSFQPTCTALTPTVKPLENIARIFGGLLMGTTESGRVLHAVVAIDEEESMLG
jgi:hypothetical protein